MTTAPFPWWPYLVALALIFAGALAPIGVTVYAANLAQHYGCNFTDGRIDPCIVDGVDQAPSLQAMASGFWYALYTWPAGIVLMVVWLLVLLWHRTRWKRRMGFDA
jgi:TRAP-type C4-dicarboxylate transport system permease small subunit